MICAAHRSLLCYLLLGAGFGFSQDKKDAAPAPDLMAAKERIKEIAPGKFELGGITFDSKTREVRVPCEVNLKQAPIEYMLVHETGKTHESVLKTPCSPIDLQVVMLLCGYEPGTEGIAHKAAPPEFTPIKPLPMKTPGANRVMMTVEWKAGEEVKRAPLATWFQDINTYKPAPDLDAWIFSGSFIDERGFVAQAEGAFVATYVVRDAMFNSPAKGNWDDQAWISLPANIPDEGTPVTLIIAPASAKK